MTNRVQLQVDIEMWPVEVIPPVKLDMQERIYWGAPKKRKRLEAEECLLVSHEEPDPERSYSFNGNRRSDSSTRG